jgi:hypothetical protein
VEARPLLVSLSVKGVVSVLLWNAVSLVLWWLCCCSASSYVNNGMPRVVAEIDQSVGRIEQLLIDGGMTN